MKLVPCILYICTAFTDATFFLFPLLFQLKCILLPLTTLKLSLLLHILMCVTITCAYFFQLLSSFSVFVELPLRAKAGIAMEDVSVAGGHLANYMQCFQQLLYCLQVCPGFGQLMILLNFHCPFTVFYLSLFYI